MKNKGLIIAIVAIVSLVCGSVAWAQDPMEQNVFVPKDKVIEYNYFKAGSLIDISGTLNKDAYVVGQTITIDGTIKGDLFCAGTDVRINGTVEGSVRCVAQTLTINGTVGKNVMAFGTSVSTGPDSQIGWELLAGGQLVNVNGTVGGNANLMGASVAVNNEINGWLFANFEDGKMSLGDNAKINGNVEYSAKQRSDLTISPQATVGGEVAFKEMTSQPKQKGVGDKIQSLIYSILGNLLVAVLLLLLMPKFVKKVGEHVRDNFGKDLGVGLLFLVVTPIACIIAAVTVIGFPVSLIAVALYFVLFYVAKVFFGLAVAYWVMKIFKLKSDNLWLVVLVGVAAVVLFKHIPYIGWLVGLVAMTSGFGAFFFVKKEELK